ncbi:hypothetical protein B9Z65_7485 [Elsinoe australis]|uniref:Nucleotide-diphospho-sugar transferase domain-containing protein n=1 Tax=Elsinoe australis TaxID=40998 RepID=A0A2P7YC95_9PEZI|nr:hypothetical protein B9Z65_7485 [Elsinoe australis]
MAASATKELSDITRLMTDFESAQQPEHGPSKASIALPGTSSAGHSSIFDVFRSLPPVDLLQEYGLSHNDLSLFPNPLREQICIVNSDTRKWSPQDHKNLSSLDILHWGYINHYLYAKMHGYTFKHIQAPEQKGFWNTWVKVKEQYRMTMEDTCKFVIMLDADIIFRDLRVPLEALLSHWNITEDIALAAGIDIDATKDLYSRTQLNTGFVITQRTPLLPSLMQDWIDCPTDVKYKNCSRWKTEFSHEQAAISNHIRDDPMYRDHIRTLAVEEIHLGGYLKHYWDREKPKLENATKDAILDRFLPAVYKGLLNDWNQVHEHPTLK